MGTTSVNPQLISCFYPILWRRKGEVLRLPTGFLKRLTDNPLQMPVRTAEFILRPLFQRIILIGIQPQNKRLFLDWHRLRVEGTGIDDRLGGDIRTQYHHQVGNHSCLALLIQVDDPLFG